MNIPFPINIPLGNWINMFVIYLTDNFAGVFDVISGVVGFFLMKIDFFFNWVPWPIMIVLVVFLSWRISGVRIAIFTAVSLLLMGMLDLWSVGMSTLALISTSVFISILIGLPLGIFSAKNDTAESIIRPILDGMQTIPPFVYLIPAIMFFGIGNVPGIIATIIFATPPMIRLTNLGIRQVNKEVIEAGHAFGSTPFQLLLKIQLPLALPSVMTGVNQTVMMSLSMVVVAAMIGAGGLGYNILYAIQRVDLAMGVEAGLGILFIAMILDRILQGITQKQKQTLFN